jgi:Transglutaminase-like superfamily
MEPAVKQRHVFRSIWWISNLLLVAALVATAWTGVWEISVRRYLRGFSDAIVPEASTPQQKAQAILAWMQNGPPRFESPAELSPRDPEDTRNYRQLLEVCGSATNAFLNLSRSAGVERRRLLLLTPERTTKHVAEVHLDGRWVIVDATYRAFLKDAQGNLLTRKDLQDPVKFREATSALPHYPVEYTYDRFAHGRIGVLPFRGAPVRSLLDRFFPTWDEYLDWSLLLERRSFLCFFLSLNALLFLILARLALAWLADHRLQAPRWHLRANVGRASAALFTTPEIK